MRLPAGRTLTLAAAAAALSLVLAACSASSTPAPTAVPTAAPTAAPTALATPTLVPTAAPTDSPTPAPTATPTPTPTASLEAAICQAANLVARITLWEGAMGHQIAHVELTNTGAACRLRALDQPQLVEGHGAVLINGSTPAASALTLFPAGGVRKALVQDANYCGSAPAAPVSVAFVLPDGAGRVVALPVSPTDLTGLPGCLGAPGSAGDIEMQPWGN